MYSESKDPSSRDSPSLYPNNPKRAVRSWWWLSPLTLSYPDCINCFSRHKPFSPSRKVCLTALVVKYFTWRYVYLLISAEGRSHVGGCMWSARASFRKQTKQKCLCVVLQPVLGLKLQTISCWHWSPLIINMLKCKKVVMSMFNSWSTTRTKNNLKTKARLFYA